MPPALSRWGLSAFVLIADVGQVYSITSSARGGVAFLFRKSKDEEDKRRYKYDDRDD